LRAQLAQTRRERAGLMPRPAHQYANTS
jgi:hypothetical protein